MKIESNAKAVTKRLSKIQKQASKTQLWAINDSAKQMHVKLPDIAREFYTIKKTAFKQRTFLDKAKKSRPEAAVKILRTSKRAGKHTPPSFFSFTKPAQTKAGVRVQIIKGSKKVIEGAFIAYVPKAGVDVVMQRRDRTKFYTKKKIPAKVAAHFPKKFKYPTRGFWGPSPAGMVTEHAGATDAERKKIIEQSVKTMFDDMLS
jgi:hypothetical protein